MGRISSEASALREFFPAALQAFDDLASSEALELLDRAPDPDRAAQLSRSSIVAMLGRANRRDIDAKAAAIQDTLRAPQLRQPHAGHVAADGARRTGRLSRPDEERRDSHASTDARIRADP